MLFTACEREVNNTNTSSPENASAPNINNNTRAALVKGSIEPNANTATDKSPNLTNEDIAKRVSRMWNHAQLTAMFSLMLQSKGNSPFHSVFCRTFTDTRTNIAKVECELVSIFKRGAIYSLKFNLNPKKEVLAGYTMQKTVQEQEGVDVLRVLDLDTDGVPEAISRTNNERVICESLEHPACQISYTMSLDTIHEIIQASLPPWYDTRSTETLVARLEHSTDDTVAKLKPSDTGSYDDMYVLHDGTYSLVIKVKHSSDVLKPVASLKLELKTDSPIEQTLLSVEDENFDGFPERVNAAEEWTGAGKVSYYRKSIYDAPPPPAKEFMGRIAVNDLFGLIEKLHIR